MLFNLYYEVYAVLACFICKATSKTLVKLQKRIDNYDLNI